MTINNKLISKGFILAGVMNSSVLLFSRGFTNKTINAYDPDVMSNFGMLMILIWGLAYISIAYKFQNVKWLVFVFAIEKLIYGSVWLQWMTTNDVSIIYDKDKMAGIFYSIYGLNDWLFCVFFLYVFIRLLKQQ
ncbi:MULTISPECIES: hypothetical protein [unclassified Olleya]|jgi:hypothetical protein|uniref:hypothetical protein n=1 Tax=unclassified Olleya TaxID=2615019 RepID=UPI0011A37EB9|nr:hypothetical protein [Olleya sp. Hel_I_94]TVZ46390.1 hypothetical protein JM82_0962 [Olleya sp. Hel_I_94]